MAQLIESTGMSPELLASARELLSNVDISNVRLESFSASRNDGRGRPARANIESTTSYAAQIGVFANKFDWSVTLLDDSDEAVAEIAASFVVEYRVEGQYTPEPAAADHVAATTGFFAVYPYAREFFESASTRLQLDPLVFGLLRVSEMQPRSVSAVVTDGVAKAEA